MIQDLFESSIAGKITKEEALDVINLNPFQMFDTADKLREEIVGDEVTFVVNRNIDITDQCLIKCDFCSFRNSIGYEMTTDEILQSIKEAKDIGATEICLFGGVMPYMTVEYYSELFETIKSSFDIELHALSPVEVYHAAELSGITTKKALKSFKKSGLDTMTGASAEILVDEVRKVICPKKVSTEEWIKIITQAHNIGIPTTSTIMYGTIESWEDRIDHMFLLRDIQRDTGGFTEFVPLTFLSQNNVAGKESAGASGMDDMKLHALARIIFGHDIPNIQASWIKMGTKMAQVILNCGANDLGGTMMEDKISIAAGASYGEYLSRKEMVSIINAIGRVPKERNTLYEAIHAI